MELKGRITFEWIFWTLLSIVLFAGAVCALFAAPLLMLFAPVPFMAIVCRRGILYGAVSAVCGAVFVFIAMGAEAAFLYICAFALLGLVMGWLLTRIESGTDYAALALAASLSLKLLMMAVYVCALGINPFVLSPEAASALSSSLSAALSHGGSLMPSDIDSYVETMAQTAALMMPSMLILFAAADTLAGYYVTRFYFRKTAEEIKIPELPPFSMWRFPRNIFWALLIGLMLDMASKAFPDAALCGMFAVNLMEVLRGVFLIEGLSLLWYFTGLYNGNRIWRTSLVVFCAFFAPMSYVLSMVGIFDIWYDLRNRIKLRRKQR